MAKGDIVEHPGGQGRLGGSGPSDPITTEVVRHALNSVAMQMKRALVRTSFSPVIYEVLDFAVAIYDRHVRLLAQAPTMPHFMGTLSFCVEAGVAAIGGEDKLLPGDVILYNWPYGVGAHAQDLAVIVPVFLDGALIGYAANKAHWLDIGGKDPYSTDTVDVFQEGTIYPGVRLYRGGVLNDDVYRIVMANSRVPKALKGDLDSQIVGCRVGATALADVVTRFGREAFETAVEDMFDHGERIMRQYFAAIPDGRYTASGQLDNDGIAMGKLVPFDLAVVVDGTNVYIDYSGAPDLQHGPFNTPVPSTISHTRVAMTMLAGFGEAPNEGHFRPIKVVTREGSMFHATPPAPCFLYAWPALQAIEIIYKAISRVLPETVPASSGGCICSIVSWGEREKTGEPWADGAPHPVGQGAWKGGDGGTMMYISQSATRLSPMEVWESRNPWLIEKMELAEDSCGPGEWRGGPGINLDFRMLEDTYVTPVVERTKNAPWGLEGGGFARANNAVVEYADGSSVDVPKVTRFLVPKGAVLRLTSGGGGGYGEPSARDPEAVRRDLRAGYISEAYARRHYPHAFD